MADRPLKRAIAETAREHFGWRQLRHEQIEAIASLLVGQDTMAVMPSGSGKSAIYQVAGLRMDRATVVISPLIALQRDQAAGIAESKAPPAETVNSSHTPRQADRAWQQVASGSAEYLFLTPEQLAGEDVVGRLGKLRPSLLVVDEAHCVSSWGHDFRPDYLRIADIRERIGHPVVLALTATASPPVRAEIVERLGMESPRQVIGGFDRPNIHLGVTQFADDASKREAVLEWVGEVPRPSLVYVGTRRDTEWYAGRLAERGLRASAYHAGQSKQDRDRTHGAFQEGRLEVVVATSAFGMGIDKADVRAVAHAHIPESPDAYYQEVGRAGRDGQPANARLFYRTEDLGLRRFFGSAGFDEHTVGAVYEAARKQPTRVADLVRATGLTRRRVTSAVGLLESAGMVMVDERRSVSATSRRRSARTALRLAAEKAERNDSMARSRLEMMRGYAETTDCRRRYLLGYFGEELATPCGNCDCCEAGTSVTGAEEAGDGLEVSVPVRHGEFGHGVVMQRHNGRVTVLFDQVGYKTLDVELATEQGVLEVRHTADAPQ